MQHQFLYYVMSFSFTAVVVVLSRRISFVLVQLIQLHGSLTRSNRDEPTSDQSHFRKKTREGNTKHLKRNYAKRREQWNERYRSTSAFYESQMISTRLSSPWCWRRVKLHYLEYRWKPTAWLTMLEGLQSTWHWHFIKTPFSARSNSALTFLEANK